MKKNILTFIAVSSALSSASHANVADPCPNEYIKPNENNKMVSYVYVLKAPPRIDSRSIELISYYNKISSERKPTYECEFFNVGSGNYSTNYNEGSCINIETNRKFSVFGGEGIEIAEDGNTQRAGGCFSSSDYCSFIEDSNGTRIRINGPNLTRRNYMINWNRDFNDNYVVLSDCRSGKIDSLTIFKAFPGYAIIQRSVETGFVDTYKRQPEIKF